MKMKFGEHQFYSDKAKELMNQEITAAIWIDREYWDDCINQSDFALIDHDYVYGRVSIQSNEQVSNDH
jgi:hypothetical protein